MPEHPQWTPGPTCASTRRRRRSQVVPHLRSEPPPDTVVLMVTRVAGVRYHAAAERSLPIDAGSRVELRAEPENPYDPRAVAIHLQSGERIGYLPRRKCTIPARLLAQGVEIFGRLEGVDCTGPELEIDVAVLLGT